MNHLEHPASAPAVGAAFWRFSLALYARPGVAEGLLRLQDSAGRNVNLVLYVLWLGAVWGRRIDAAELAVAAAAIGPLHDGGVEPLRRLRRDLKAVPAGDVRALRQRVLQLELAAERLVQHRLAAALDLKAGQGEEDRIGTVCANLALYLGTAAATPDAALLHAAAAALIQRA